MKLDEPYAGEAQVLHFLEVLRDKIGFDELKKKVVNPLTGKKIGAYYGCLLLRPGNILGFDNPENPTIIEDFIRAIGAEPVIYARRNECCGGYCTIENKAYAQNKVDAIMENAKALEYFSKARNLQLTDEDFRTLSGFKQKGYEKALRAEQAAQQLKLDIAAGKTNVKTAPNVPADKVFQAILDRYRGKVVLVDFWGLGCAGCVLDSEEWLEPMKKGFDGEDVVWLNIVDERNDIVPYTIEIAKIQGEHYRLTRKQWEAIGKQHGFNYIPCYFLVGKDGKYRMINNLRGTTGFERAIREELAK
jgi:thiol-disulfide isomerase/thioredoxin